MVGCIHLILSLSLRPNRRPPLPTPLTSMSQPFSATPLRYKSVINTPTGSVLVLGCLPPTNEVLIPVPVITPSSELHCHLRNRTPFTVRPSGNVNIAALCGATLTMVVIIHLHPFIVARNHIDVALSGFVTSASWRAAFLCHSWPLMSMSTKY